MAVDCSAKFSFVSGYTLCCTTLRSGAFPVRTASAGRAHLSGSLGTMDVYVAFIR